MRVVTEIALAVVLAFALGACGRTAHTTAGEAVSDPSLELADDLEQAQAVTREGTRLAADRVSHLEKRLQEKPGDLRTRLLLLGFYGRNGGEAGPSGEPYDTLAFEILKRYPRSLIAGQCVLNGAAFERGAAHFRALVSAHPDDAAIIGNAGAYLAADIFDLKGTRREGLTLLERAEKLAPTSPRWPWTLGMADVYAIAASTWSRVAAARALARLERARALAGSSPPRWLLVDLLRGSERMVQLAWIAGDRPKARKLAFDTLDLAKTWKVDWQRANAINAAETVLGYVALAEGQVEEAEKHLLASARVDGSPHLNTSPDFGLAAELLARGRSETVLSFLDLCSKFVDYSLDDLKRAIRAGEQPDFTGRMSVALRSALQASASSAGAGAPAAP